MSEAIERLREEIAATDRMLLEAVNRRLELVRRIRAEKEASGVAFVDREQEERLLAALERMNPGPLSTEGLHELFGHLLELTKREGGWNL
jgi:chorismate mutase